MHSIILLSMLVSLQQVSCNELHHRADHDHYGNDFYLGYLKNFQSASEKLWLMVFTNSTSDTVFFHVKAPFFNILSNTSLGNPVTIDLPVDLVVEDSSFLHRFKVVLFNYEAGSVGEYLGLPYSSTTPLSSEYVYYTISVQSVEVTESPPLWSEALLVGCQQNTTITITPTVPLMIPIIPQIPYSPDVIVGAGQKHTFTLNEGQTLYIGKPDSDITGTQIVSNKPITVISGHECGTVPHNVTWCENLVQQIPPTFTWGRQFLLVPFKGKETGQYYKIVTANDFTYVIFTCNDTNSLEVNLKSHGDTHSFFASSYTYCHLFADKPVLLVQLATGAGYSDGVGDPVMIQVQPIEQYSHHFLEFSSFNSNIFAKSYISITTTKGFHNILYDEKPLNEVTWTAIYDSSSRIVGYGCHFEVDNGVHTVTHSDGIMSVLLYGFHNTTKRAYGYPVGVKLNPTDRDIDISFTNNAYVVHENHTTIDVGLKTSYITTTNTTVLVKTIAKSAEAGRDYQELNKEVVFGIGENYKQVTIIINNDEWVEPLEQFIITLVPLLEHVTSDINETIVTIIDDDSIITSFMNDLIINDQQKISLLQGIQEGELQPGASTILTVKISLLQDEVLYSAFHHVSFTYYVTHSEIYFDISRILPEGTHIKPGTIITAILSKEPSDVNIIMREDSLNYEMTVISFKNITSIAVTSQEITSTSVTSQVTNSTSVISQETTFTSVTSQESNSTFTKLSTSNVKQFSLTTEQVTSCLSILITTVTVTSTISLTSTPFIESEEAKLTSFNFIHILSITLASASVIIFITLFFLILIMVIFHKRKVNHLPSSGVTNPYQIPPNTSDESIFEVPYSDKHHEDTK